MNTICPEKIQLTLLRLMPVHLNATSRRLGFTDSNRSRLSDVDNKQKHYLRILCELERVYPRQQLNKMLI